MKKNGHNVGLDILRILSMLGIIGLHLIGCGGMLGNLDLMNYRTYVIVFIYVICFFSVDIFGILSGYLSWKKKKNNYSRIVELIFVTFFYSFSITLIFYLFNLYGFRTFDIKEIIYSLFPAAIGRYWYITSYIFVFFMMPYLNFFIDKLEQKYLKNMLIVIFVMLSIIPNVFFQIDFFRTMSGYSAIWLLYCYMLGGYLGKYGLSKKIYKKRISIAVFCIVLAYISNILVRLITFKMYNHVLHDSWFIDYVSPFIVIGSLILVSLFSEFKFKNPKFCKMIVLLSTCSFAVYIIHSHYLVYDYFILDIMKFSLSYNVVVIVLYFILFGLGIYFACSIIELLRILIFKIFFINGLINKIGNKLNNLLN